jgi:hypothetical protein
MANAGAKRMKISLSVSENAPVRKVEGTPQLAALYVSRYAPAL